MKIKTICRSEIIYKNGKSPLAIRFTHQRAHKLVSLGISVEPRYWDKEAEMLTAACPDRAILQSQIDSTLASYRKKIQRLEALDVAVDFSTLFGTASKYTPQLVDAYFRERISDMKQAGKINTAIKYAATRTSLGKFHPAPLRFEEINLTLLNEFEYFLHNEGNQPNSIATKFSVLKAVYNKAIVDKIFLCKENPFLLYKVGKHWTATRKRAIHKEDIQRLMQAELPPTRSRYAEFARDIFLFSYFSAGINFTDMATLRYGDIVDGRIYYSRHKTQKLLSFHLVPNALQIIQKYSKRGHAKEDYIFPILNRNVHRTPQQIFNRTHKVLAKINRELKVLGKLIGLEVPLTTYVARHTYATVLKRSGVSVALISESLGHSDLSTTQIYLDSFENAQIDEAMQHLL